MRFRLRFEVLEVRSVPAGLLDALARDPSWISFSPPAPFDPDQNTFPSDDPLRASLHQLRVEGWHNLVTYSLDGTLADVPRIAKEEGFQLVVAGIFWFDAAQLAREKQAAAAQNGFIDGYVLGNEGLIGNRYTFTQLTQEIDALRTSTGKPVTTSEPGGEYLSNPALLQVGDWIFPNVHPWFANIRDIPSAVQFTVNQTNALKAQAPGRLVDLHESWWPTGGGDPAATEANQVAYFRGLAGTGIPFIYGEAYDQFWKTAEGSQGPHWGFHTSDGTPKAIVGALRPVYDPLLLSPTVAVGAGAGAQASVYGLDGSATPVSASGGAFAGGVRVAVGDVNGDGSEETIIGSGPGGPSAVQVIDGKGGAVLREIAPFEAGFTGGVFVAAADLNGDGAADFVVTPDQGGGPRVRIFDGRTGNVIADFLGIEDPNFRGGARAALADVNGDGTPDLLVAAGFGGGPRIAVFDGKSLASGNPRKLFGDFFVFEQSLRNGVFIAGGDLNGDGFADVVAGGGPGGGPRVFALSGKDLLAGNQTQVANFFGGDPNSRGGIRVAAKDLDADQRADLVVGAGEGAGSLVTEYAGKDFPADGTPAVLRQFEAFLGVGSGVFVG